MSFLEQASKAIRESGGRMTPQRRLIIQMLETSKQHLDVDSLYHLAYERDESVSLATVYRTLNALEETGMVRPSYLSRDHEHKHYEIASDDHYHFTCRNCHRVIEFQSERIQELKHKLEAELDVEVVNACVCFNGLCPDCRAKQAEAQMLEIET